MYYIIIDVLYYIIYDVFKNVFILTGQTIFIFCNVYDLTVSLSSIQSFISFKVITLNINESWNN